MRRHGWNLFVSDHFRDRVEPLISEVERLKATDPDGYTAHPSTKLLRAVFKATTDRVPRGPDATEFRLGQSLGAGRGHWRRVKSDLPPRHRLFFRFDTTSRSIVYVWFNDDGTLRKAGARTDVYKIFGQMLERCEIPDDFETLKSRAGVYDAILGNLPARPVQIPPDVVDRVARGMSPVRAWRLHRRYERDDVAHAVGLSTDDLAAIEDGARAATETEIEYLAEVLAADPAALTLKS